MEDRPTAPAPADRAPAPPPPAPSDSPGVGLAAGLATVWGILVVLYGLLGTLLLPLLAAGQKDGGYCESGDHPGPCPSPLEFLAPGAAVLVAGIWTTLASRAYMRGRPWARWPVAVTFALWAGAALGGAVVVAAADALGVGALAAWLAFAAGFAAIAVTAARRSA